LFYGNGSLGKTIADKPGRGRKDDFTPEQKLKIASFAHSFANFAVKKKRI